MLKNVWDLALHQLHVVHIRRGSYLCSKILLNDAMKPSTFTRHFHSQQV